MNNWNEHILKHGVYTDDGTCLWLKYPDPDYPEVSHTMWCAIGRADPWPAVWAPVKYLKRYTDETEREILSDSRARKLNRRGYDC